MRKGFSLVELSIVLVILGLLVGGVLSGQSLIRAAELRATGTEYQRYLTAVGSFRDKYFALPGDMNNATQFWATAGTCPGNNASPSTTAATCNGDGDGQITLTNANSNEVFRFWQHLANAGLVEGSYSGVANSATAAAAESRLGWNVPASKLSNAGWTPQYIGSVAINSASGLFEGDYGNLWYYGAVSAANLTGDPSILKPEEAWNIDTKLDDGKPGTGRITTWEGSPNCHDATPSATVAIAGTANYALNITTTTCSLFMKIGY